MILVSLVKHATDDLVIESGKFNIRKEENWSKDSAFGTPEHTGFGEEVGPRVVTR